MNILYQLATLPPKMPGTEAITQEVTALRRRFGGDVVYVNPNQQFPLHIPRLLFGFHKLKKLRKCEINRQLHHFYNPDPFPFPYLHKLRRPVLYSVTCGVSDKQLNVAFFRSLAGVVVADKRNFERIKSWGVDNTFLVQPGIDTTRFTCSPLALRSEIKLMVGSAPWTSAQFHTKGVEALLAAAQQAPHLHLVFLWRGVLADKMMNRVRQLKLEEQVTVLDKVVDVNRVLAEVHATIVLATNSFIIKSYPHSLLDSLAAGKPVLVSRAIPMADYVEEKGCGKVVESVTATDTLTAIEVLAHEYDTLQKSAQVVGQQDFSQQAMIDSYQKVYEQALSLTSGRS